jgi:hypothetical protein
MKLYKYFPRERIDFISKRMVRLTPPSAFNDPFDMLPIGKVTIPDEQDISADETDEFSPEAQRFLNTRLAPMP